MTTKTMKLALAAVAVLGVGAATAQEMGSVPVAPSIPAAASATVPATAPEAAPAAQVAMPTPPDQGPATVVQAQQEVPSVAVNRSTKNARAVVQEKISAKYTIGYDEKRGSIIQIGFAQAPVADPAKSANYIQVRDMLAREAMLNAKMAIAKLVRQKVSALNRVSILGTRENAEYSRKYADQIAAAQQQQDKVKQLLAQLESAEANRLEGVTVGDRWNALMDGIIARIDAKYSTQQVGGEKKEQYRKVKEAYEEAVRRLEDLRQKAVALAPPVGDNESEMASQAKIKLLGATTLLQAESWDGMNYQVAMAVVWSPKLQERAVKTLGMAIVETSQKGDLPLMQWLQKNTGALASMVGSRQYSDDRGRQYVLGISACEVSDDVNMQQQDMEQTDMFAQQAVVFALFSEGKADQKAAETMVKYKGNNPNDTKSAYAKSLHEEVKNLSISGLGKVFDTQLTHPISGKEIYVSVAAVDSALAAKSNDILRSMYGAAGEVIATSDYLRGQEQGMEDALNAVKQSQETFNRGRKAGQQAIGEELQNRFNINQQQQQGQGVQTVPVQPPEAKPDGKSRKGVFIPDPKMTDDF